MFVNDALNTKLEPFVLTVDRFYRGMAGTIDAPLSLGAGTPAIGELSVAVSELAGLRLDTADELYALIDVNELSHFDLNQDLHALATVESGKTGTTTGVILTMNLKGVSSAEAFTDAKVAPDSTITFPTFNCTASIPKDTAKQAAAAKGLFVADRFIMLAITCTNKGDAAADDIRLLSITLFGTAAFLTADGHPKQMT